MKNKKRKERKRRTRRTNKDKDVTKPFEGKNDSVEFNNSAVASVGTNTFD
jgi:hypothetical protein